MRDDWKAVTPGGGRAAGTGGGFYHLSVRSGSRGTGSRAVSAYEYVTRSGEYDDPARDALVYTESDHMPAWAQDDARVYWDAADLYERANGRLYVSADFALPRDLETADQVALGHAFAQELTAGERLPYTLAIHAGLDADGQSHNPHAHVMISERQHDGHERSREQWFRRADAVHPERGGAPKTRSLHGRAWMEQARERWASLTNAALARVGHDVRVDHRSYERQGIDREPGQHFGPATAHMVHRAEAHDRLEGIAAAVTDQERLQAADHAMASLEAVRETWLREDESRRRAEVGRATGAAPKVRRRVTIRTRGGDRWRMRSTCFVPSTRPPKRSRHASKRSKRR
jgi:hypothetical protein